MRAPAAHVPSTLTFHAMSTYTRAVLSFCTDHYIVCSHSYGFPIQQRAGRGRMTAPPSSMSPVGGCGLSRECLTMPARWNTPAAATPRSSTPYIAGAKSWR